MSKQSRATASVAAKIREIANDNEVEIDDIKLAQLAVLAANAEHLPKNREAARELGEVTLKLRQALNDYDDLILPFVAGTKEQLKTIRDVRMNIIPEIAQLMNGLRDVRKFFLDKDYKEEMGRLKEFVELMERLQALKKSGFLDTVADTILKLEQVK